MCNGIRLEIASASSAVASALCSTRCWIGVDRRDRMPSPDLVRESQCRRHGDGLLIDAVVAADARWRSLQKALEGARTQQRSHGSLRRGKPPSAGDDAAAVASIP